MSLATRTEVDKNDDRMLLLLQTQRSVSNSSTESTASSSSRQPTISSSYSSSGEDEESMAYIVSNDCINQFLRENGVTWRRCPQLLSPSPKAALAMRHLVRKFTSSSAQLDRGYQQWIEDFPLGHETCYPHFLAVADGVFRDEIQWGRIVALYSLACDIALKAGRLEPQRQEMIGNIADYVAAYTESHLDTWIQERGGWEKFGEHFAPADNDDKIMSNVEGVSEEEETGRNKRGWGVDRRLGLFLGVFGIVGGVGLALCKS